MRAVIVRFGLISGGIIIVLGVLNTILWKAGTLTFDNGEIFGYTAMLVSLSFVFFGIKSFRDKNQQGVLTFGKGFQVGILITLIASLFYVAGWELYYNTDQELKTTFMEKYKEHSLAKMKERGATEEQIDAASRQMDELKKSYENPFFRMGLTLMEIFPVGLVVTLISAGILRKRRVLPS